MIGVVKGPLRSFLHRMIGDPDDAGLVQETAIRAYEQVASFSGDASFRTWRDRSPAARR
jgi:DNA-directed RNA polymerase specialized sigma24 family protein